MTLLLWLYMAFIVTAVADLCLFVARDHFTEPSRWYSLANWAILNLVVLLLIVAGIITLNVLQGVWLLVAVYLLLFGANAFNLRRYCVDYDNWLKRRLTAGGSSTKKLL